ncbi:MAG: hydroxymethylglutaryl-CoA reductase, degradative [Myxococcales bacterium]|nr:hydroxymethylglutaryl-CoA reductase, degradative [Myxococcales bacterium]
MVGKRNSRLPGFYKLSVEQRRRMAAEALGVTVDELVQAIENGGLGCERADKIIENVVGTFALPFALTLNVKVNGDDFVVPMVVEEPSVVAAASNAAKMIRAGGGFEAEADDPIMISQVQLDGVPDATTAGDRIMQHRSELLELGNRAVPGLVRRGGGVRGLEVRDLGEGMLVVHFFVDCRDAMGANLVNTVAEAVADRVQELSGGDIGLRILSNLCDERKVRIRCRVPAHALGSKEFAGEAVRDAVVRASRFAEKDPYRATTHNKGLMNGLDAVVLATGNDWRAVESGAHAYASRSGTYRPLCVWRADGNDLVGELEIPLSLGTVGGPSRVHDGARMGLKIVGAQSASELAMVAASVGMASNLAALRALATEGIQRGHMALHARSVAIAAGASGDEVEAVAKRIHSQGQITLDAAETALRDVRRAAVPVRPQARP